MHVHAGHDDADVLCPVIGRVCMDQVMLDVTGVEGVSLGSDVTVYSTRRDDPNSVESVARTLDTIPHEITCGLTARVPHVYLPARAPAEKPEAPNPKPD
jgi:alanine racemase